MSKEQLEAFTHEAAKTSKTEQDPNDFRDMLTKVTRGYTQSFAG